MAFPLLARAFSQLEIDAEVTVCSSSGWAHGAQASGRKIVYCHAPARWLYQTDRYLGARAPAEGLDMTDRVRLGLKRGRSELARSQLLQWDKKAALSADKYLSSPRQSPQRCRGVGTRPRYYPLPRPLAPLVRCSPSRA